MCVLEKDIYGCYTRFKEPPMFLGTFLEAWCTAGLVQADREGKGFSIVFVVDYVLCAVLGIEFGIIK